MASDLNFKLVLDADNKQFVYATNQTRESVQKMFESFKSQAPIESANAIDKVGNESQQAAKQFDVLEKSVSEANEKLSETEKVSGKVGIGVDGLKAAFGLLAGAMAAIGVGLGVKELIEAADQYTTLSAKIKIATDNGGDFASAMTAVQNVAIATNSSLESTAGLFVKINDVGQTLGLTQQQVLQVTETINKAMQLGGSSAQASEAAVTQLTQALQSGVLRGDEFNSIMEQAPAISKLLAKELGVTTGELRKMAEAGELSSERVIKAFQNQSALVSAEYDKIPLTVSGALQKIQTAWLITVGELDNQAGNASGIIAQVLSSLADNMGVVKVIFSDIIDGISAIGERFKGLAGDGSIDALKNAIGALYEAFKTVVSTAFELGTAVYDVFSVVVKNAIGTLGAFFGVVQDGGNDLNLVKTTLDGVSIVLGVLSDGIKGAKIALELLGGAALFLAGHFLKAQGEILDFIPLMGTMAEQAKINGERLLEQGKTLISEANKDALSFESEAKKRLDRAVESESQATARILAEKKKALDDTLALQSSEELGNAKLQAQKLQAVQAYAEEAVKANDGILSSELQLELAKKGYYATIAEGGKVAISTLTAEEQATADATLAVKQQEAAYKSAATVAEKFGIDLSASLNKVGKEFTTSGATLSEFVGNLKTAGITGSEAANLIYQAWEKWLSQAKNTAEIDAAQQKLQDLGSTGQITGEQLKAGMELAHAAAKDLNPALNAAREAGKALGIDIDKTTNIMSQGFAATSSEIDTLKTTLAEAGIAGKEAANTLYKAWEAWLSKADSKVELETTKQKLQEMASAGVISTKQLEAGMYAVKSKTEEVGMAADGTAEAFKRLGIQTKDALAAQAKEMLSAFEKVRQSGQATQADLQAAYQKTITAAYASGDAAVIANANAQAASLGLAVQVDDTGKATVQSYAEMDRAAQSHKQNTDGVKQGYKEIGDAAEEAGQKAKAGAKSEKSWGDFLEGAAQAFRSQTNNYAKQLEELGKTAGYAASEAQKMYEELWREMFRWSSPLKSANERMAEHIENLKKAREQQERNNAAWEEWNAKVNQAQASLESAMASAKSFQGSIQSINDEYLKATGQEDKLLQQRYAQRKQQLNLEYELLKVTIQKAKVEAQAAKLDTKPLDQALSEATRGFEEAKKQLVELEKMEKAKLEESKKVEAAKAKQQAETAKKEQAQKKAEPVNAVKPPAIDKSTAQNANVDTKPKQTVNYNINFNGKNIELSGDASQRDNMDALINELERYKKGM